MSVIQKQTLAKSWRTGAPPSVGWWPTRNKLGRKWAKGLRWWDGEQWSARAPESFDAWAAGCRAQIKALLSITGSIQYRERLASWPAHSRT